MNERSIRKLKRKFVGMSTLSFLIVMCFIAGLIYFGNLFIVNTEIHDVLKLIVSNQGELPQSKTTSSKATFESIQEAQKESENMDISIADQLTGFFGLQGTYNTPEFLYSTRFFSVIYPVDSTDRVQVKSTHMASVDDTEAVSLANRLKERVLKFGQYNSYYYQVDTLSDGSTIVVVMDCTSQIALSQRILKLAAIFMGFGAVLSFLILRAFSGRIIAPEVRNSENQKRFITNASHELKTPLAVIRANTELTEAMSGETEWTKATLRQVDRLQGLIQNLVLITRAEEQDDKQERMDMDLSAAVNDVLDNYAPVAEQEGLTLDRQVPEGLHMQAAGGQIRQLVTLFVDNAIKYCDPGGQIQVRVSKAKRGRATILEFSNDYAKGKDVDYARFFDRFYRADESHNTDRGGYGIGLSIAESIVEQYHGIASVDWKDGRIIFTCRLLG
jgi:signal transduction histidine kinase